MTDSGSIRYIQSNPAIAFYKGPVKIMLYNEVLSIADMKTLLGTICCMLYWRNYVKSGCAMAGFHCNMEHQTTDGYG